MAVTQEPAFRSSRVRLAQPGHFSIRFQSKSGLTVLPVSGSRHSDYPSRCL